MLQLTFNPGLTLTGFQTTRPWRLQLFVSCHCLRYPANVLFTPYYFMAPSNPQGLFDCVMRETIMHQTHYLFSDCLKVYREFFKICACDVNKLQITIIMSRPHKVIGNHVRALCVTCFQWRSKNMTSVFFVFFSFNV